MKIRLAAFLIVTAMQPASAQEPNPYEGKSAAEVATYLVLGLEDKLSMTERGSELSVETVASDPLTLAVKVGGSEGLRVTTTTTDNCTFAFEVSAGPVTVSLDLTKLASVRQIGATEAQFTGAVLACVAPSDQSWCANMQRDENPDPEFKRYALRATGELNDPPGERFVVEQARIEAALSYFRQEICPK